MKAQVIKKGNVLIPAFPADEEIFERIKRGHVTVEIKQPRNPKFHKKYFALLNVGFDLWEPGEISSKHGTPEKNFDQFREDITILAGYYESSIRLNGEVRIVAKSISFAKMDDVEFDKLYNTIIDVLIKHVCVRASKEDINQAADLIIGFA